MGRDFAEMGMYSGEGYDFNPRARMGRDLNRNNGMDFKASISIHAPVWGATTYLISGVKYYKISIHAPVWGATVTTAQAQ